MTDDVEVTGRGAASAVHDVVALDGVTLEVAEPAPLLERARTAAFEDATASVTVRLGLG